jgi:long-chain acyl-CoA synthetase
MYYAALKGMSIAAVAAEDPERPAIYSPKGDLTFGELNARINQLARALERRGLNPDDGVGLLVSNRPEFVEALFAGFRSGLRTTPINWHLGPEEIAYILGDCKAKAFIADAEFAEAAAEAADLAEVPVRLSVGGEISGFESYEKVLGSEPASDIENPILGKTMLYTSGTTGRPKGVYRGDAEAIVAERFISAYNSPAAYKPGEDLVLVSGPLYHAAPYAFSLTGPMFLGVGIVIMEDWDSEEMLRLVERYRITQTHLVAIHFHRLLQLPEDVRRRYDLSSLRYIIHGAAPTPVELKRQMMEWLGPVIYEYYAATEGAGTYISPDEWLQKPGSVGKPMDPEAIKVLNDEGVPVQPGVVGTIYIRPAAPVRFEYFNDVVKTASAYRGDYFTLGDLGYFDKDGYLFVSGRTADVIISGGVNIYPAEVDEVLSSHPAVADSATVGIPNDEWGEEVKSVVMLREGFISSPDLADELIEFCRSHLAHYKCPRTVDFVDQLPREDTGKIYRRLVRDRYL